jgi:Protein of unknown function (DUF1348)
MTRRGQWWRSYGNELWEFDEHGLMRRREASINDVPIDESQRRIFGPRPAGERQPLSRRAIGGSYSPPRPVGHGNWLLPMLTPDVLPVRRDACRKPVRPADPLKSS